MKLILDHREENIKEFSREELTIIMFLFLQSDSKIGKTVPLMNEVKSYLV